MQSTGFDTTTVVPQPSTSEYRLLDQHKTNVRSAHSRHRTRPRKSLICDGAVSKNRKHPNRTLYYASDTTESSSDTLPPRPQSQTLEHHSSPFKKNHLSRGQYCGRGVPSTYHSPQKTSLPKKYQSHHYRGHGVPSTYGRQQRTSTSMAPTSNFTAQTSTSTVTPQPELVISHVESPPSPLPRPRTLDRLLEEHNSEKRNILPYLF